MTRLSARTWCLVLLATACGSPTGPTRPALTLESGLVFGIPTLRTEVRVENGVAIVTGVIQTPGTGYTLSGEVTLTGGNHLSVEIHAYDNAPGFPFQSQNYYRATIRNIVPGDYEFSVIHNHHASAPGITERVYHENVRIQ